MRRLCLAFWCLQIAFGTQVAGAATPIVIDPIERLQDFRSQGQFIAGLDQADRYLEEFPHDVDILLIKGQFLAYLERFDEALVSLEIAENLSPDYVDIKLTRARVYGYQRKFKKALAVLKSLERKTQSQSEVLLLEGVFALRDSQLHRAKLAFGHALAQNPDNVEALLGLGDVAREKGEIHLARLYYEKGLGPGDAAMQRIAGTDQPVFPFEVILAGDYSKLTSGNSSWKEASTELAYRPDDATRIAANFIAAERFNESDILAGIDASYRINSDFSIFAGLATTPDADFLPIWRVRGGGDYALLNGDGDFLGATTVFLDGTIADYEPGIVKSIGGGLRQYSRTGASWLTVRLSGTLDANSDFGLGGSVRFDSQIVADITVFLGAGHEQDNEDERTLTTNSLFFGVRYDLKPDLGLTTSATIEDRPDGVRRYGVGLAIVRKF